MVVGDLIKVVEFGGMKIFVWRNNHVIEIKPGTIGVYAGRLGNGNDKTDLHNCFIDGAIYTFMSIKNLKKI